MLSHHDTYVLQINTLGVIMVSDSSKENVDSNLFYKTHVHVIHIKPYIYIPCEAHQISQVCTYSDIIHLA